MSVKKFLKIVFWAVVIIIILALLNSCSDPVEVAKEKVKTGLDSLWQKTKRNGPTFLDSLQARTKRGLGNINNTMNQGNQSVKSGTDSTLNFSDYQNQGEKIIVDIQSSCKFYPQGGKVKITPPYGPDSAWVSIPGKMVKHPKLIPGTYTFESADLNATGIEIIWK